jgi:hypothetical protein
MFAHSGRDVGEAKKFVDAVAKAAGDTESKDRIRSVEDSFKTFRDGGNVEGFPSLTINVLTGIVADYAATAAMETFAASHSDRHPTDLAMLRGARLVTASETEEGRAWAVL